MCVCSLSEYLCHVYVRNDSLGAVVIADGEYPSRVCFTLLDKVGQYPSRVCFTLLDKVGEYPSGYWSRGLQLLLA